MKKGGILCQEVTVQGRQDKAAVWVEVEARVEAEWAGRLQRDRAEVVCVRTAEQQLLMLPDSLVTQEAVLNVVRK